MKIWLLKNNNIVFKVLILGGYFIIQINRLPLSKKRRKIKVLDINSLAWSVSYSSPPFNIQDVIAIVDFEIKYWYELKNICKRYYEDMVAI